MNISNAWDLHISQRNLDLSGGEKQVKTVKAINGKSKKINK